MLIKKIIFFVILVVFLFSCVKKEQVDKVVEEKQKRSEKPETGLKPEEPVLLRYTFDKIPEGKVYELKGNIEIEIKIIPDQEKQDKFIELPSDFIFDGTLIKTGMRGNGAALFNFKINKLSINVPGPGVNIDYKSENSEKYLNPQIEKLDLFVGKIIPVKISEFGKIFIDSDAFFSTHEDLRPILTDEYMKKIKLIIGYFFFNYPEKSKKIGESFTSELPFNGEYEIDSLTKDRLNTLIIPKNTKFTDKNVLSSSLKGWIFINNMGMLKRSFLQLTEKKYMNYNELRSIIKKKILIDLKVTEK